MKNSVLGVAVIAGLFMLSAVAYAEEAAPPPETPKTTLVPLNRDTLERMQKEDKAAAAAQKAKKDEKDQQAQKQAKVEKIERRTGKKSKSWQVQNR